MSLSIELPHDIETLLRTQVRDLDQSAKEACLVEFYRQGQITHHQLAAALGLDRNATDGVLKRHRVWYEYSADELRQQVDLLSIKR
jgi:predicted HTH domain antitoxin